VAKGVRGVSTPILVAIIAFASSLFGALLGSFLQQRNIEHEIQYAKLHENRAEVVGRLYALAYGTQLTLQRWVLPFPGRERHVQIEEVRDRYNELVDYYYPNALWLEKNSRKTLEQLILTMKDVFEDFSVLPGSGAPIVYQVWNEPPPEDMGAIRHEINMKVLKEIPQLREPLDDAFQTLLYPRRSWWSRLFGR
jgi:hypothetical protein